MINSTQEQVAAALNTLTTGNADQLTDEQLCGLAVHYAVILRSTAPSDTETIRNVFNTWNKMPPKVYHKFVEYVITTKNLESQSGIKPTWEDQVAAIRKYGMVQ